MGLFSFVGDLFDGVGEIVGDIAGAVGGAVSGGGATGGITGALFPSGSSGIIGSIFGGSEDVLDTGMSLFAPTNGPQPGSWLNSPMGGHVLRGVGQALLAPDPEDEAKAIADARADAEIKMMRERQKQTRANYGLGPQAAPQAAPGVIDTGQKYKRTGLSYG